MHTASLALVAVLLAHSVLGAVDLDNSSWKVWADSEQSGMEAVHVLSRDYSSIWHTAFQDAELPHILTIDTGSSQMISQLTYTPRRGSSLNGNIGAYQIWIVPNQGQGSPVKVAEGQWQDNKAPKIAEFEPMLGRYVRLVVLSEAGGRGPWASAAHITLQGPDEEPIAATVVPEDPIASAAAPAQAPAAVPAPAPSQAGSKSSSTNVPLAGASSEGLWGPVIELPLIAVAASNLPNGKVLLWSAYKIDHYGRPTKDPREGYGYTQTALFDPVTGDVTPRTVSHTEHDMFCPGTVLLPDGNVHVAGGMDAYEVSVYDWQADDWVAGAKMNVPRGYQGNCPLPDGSVFTLGGSFSGGSVAKPAEIWSPGAGWTRYDTIPPEPIMTDDPEGQFRADNHLWLIPFARNLILHAGPSRAMHIIDLSNGGSITEFGERSDSDQLNGNAVMYDAYKVLTVGGAPTYEKGYDDPPDLPRGQLNPPPAVDYTHVITVSGGQVTWRETAPLNMARTFACANVLPDGSVLVTGGQAVPRLFNDVGAVYEAELWDPSTETWRVLAPEKIPRTYHSVAVLLPDGRVFVSGGGLCNACDANHLDYEIFTPPYLLTASGALAPRPSILSAPVSVTVGGTFTVETDEQIAYFSLVRLGASTHTVNNDIRRVRLEHTATGTTAQVTVPDDPWIVLPGYWYLFAMNMDGVPSVAEMVNVAL